jgi:hypothetical protein
VDYAYNAAAADHVVLERSTDTITWTDEATDMLTGQFLSTDLSAGYLRLRLEDAANATIAKSFVQYWSGSSLPIPNAPPIITSVYPVIVGGVPKLRVQYTSNLSWFDVMVLQLSADGVRGWVTPPGSNASPTSYFDFDDPNGAVFVRVQAMDNSGTVFAWSQPYYWNGTANAPGGGSPPPTPAATAGPTPGSARRRAGAGGVA